MSRLRRIRKQAMSLRGGLAVGGALAIAVSLTQVAGTLAATDLEPRTAKVPIATANYYPTPLTTEVRCRTTGGANLAGRRAEVSWNPVAEATGYRLEILTWNSSNPDTTITQTYTVGAGTTSVGSIRDSDRDVLYARVRTINGPAVSSGYATPRERISFKDWLTGRTECENTGHPTFPNDDRWENDQSWSPEVESFGIGQPLVSALNELDLGADGIDDELAVVATLDDAAAEPSKAEAPDAKSAEATTAATGTSIETPRTSSSTAPTTAPAERSTSSSSSTSAPPSSKATSPSPSTTRASSSAAATPTAPSTTRAAATSTTVPVTSTATTEATTVTPVALPGGGEAKLVGGTTLVVSDDDGPVCSATVREGSTLKVRSGVLEVTDARETREVDPQTCELT